MASIDARLHAHEMVPKAPSEQHSKIWLLLEDGSREKAPIAGAGLSIR